MKDEDDEFWTNYIANTPEDEASFTPLGKGLLIVGAFALVAFLAFALLR